MDEVLLPAPALVPDPELVPDPALDVDPRLEPKLPMFGLVGALQNVAVISCWQTMPVSGSGELFVRWDGPAAARDPMNSPRVSLPTSKNWFLTMTVLRK